MLKVRATRQGNESRLLSMTGNATVYGEKNTAASNAIPDRTPFHKTCIADTSGGKQCQNQHGRKRRTSDQEIAYGHGDDHVATLLWFVCEPYGGDCGDEAAA